MGKLSPRIPREHDDKYHGAHTYVNGARFPTILLLALLRLPFLLGGESHLCPRRWVGGVLHVVQGHPHVRRDVGVLRILEGHVSSPSCDERMRGSDDMSVPELRVPCSVDEDTRPWSIWVVVHTHWETAFCSGLCQISPVTFEDLCSATVLCLHD